MKLVKSLKIALNIILHSKLRSWLTIIGIVIGIAAIVAIVSIGQGAQKTLESNLNTLSADVITISSGMSRASGPGADFRPDFGAAPSTSTRTSGSTKSTVKNLTTTDLLAIKTIPNVLYAAGIISGNVDNVTYLSKTSRVTIQGIDPIVMKQFVTSEIYYGRYLGQGDSDSVVIGGRVANSTFSDMQVNRKIIINGKTFKIVGILKTSGNTEDSRIFMPIDSAVTIIDNKDSKSFDSISVKIKDISLTDETVAAITSKLMTTHSILQSSKQDFSVTSQKTMQERISSTLNSMSIFLTAIAAISLIVGAIGIMNTMFTSVLEKTREIGILKALGAKNRDILAIFLLNAGIIGFIGGIFGVILGIIASGYIGVLVGGTSSSLGGPGGGIGRLLSSTYVSPELVLGIFALSIFVGLVSGMIPAYRASRLKPVDALRYE